MFNNKILLNGVLLDFRDETTEKRKYYGAESFSGECRKEERLLECISVVLSEHIQSGLIFKFSRSVKKKVEVFYFHSYLELLFGWN